MDVAVSGCGLLPALALFRRAAEKSHDAVAMPKNFFLPPPIRHRQAVAFCMTQNKKTTGIQQNGQTLFVQQALSP